MAVKGSRSKLRPFRWLRPSFETSAILYFALGICSILQKKLSFKTKSLKIDIIKEQIEQI